MTKIINIEFLKQNYVLKLQLNGDWIDVFIDELPLISVKRLKKADLYIYSRLCEYFTRYIVLRSDYQVHAQFKNSIKPIIYTAVRGLKVKSNAKFSG